MIKSRVVFLFLLLSVFTLLSCSKGGGDTNVYRSSDANIYNKIDSVELVNPNIVLYPKISGRDAFKVKAVVKPDNAFNKQLKYEVVLGKEFIKFDSKSLIVYGIKAGVAQIKVSSVADSSKYKLLDIEVSDSNVIPGETTGPVIWEELPSQPVTSDGGNQVMFTEELPKPKTLVSESDILSLIGHYRIQYMTVKGQDGDSLIVDNIVGNGRNMFGEIAVNAEFCDPDFEPVGCPSGIKIRMQFKSQIHSSRITDDKFPESLKFIRRDIFTPIVDTNDVMGEFLKVGAKYEVDPQKKDEYIVLFDLDHNDVPIPEGYIMHVKLKKIADDTLFDSLITLDSNKYFSENSRVTSIVARKNITTLQIGQKETIIYDIYPVDAENKSVTFKSDRPEIASVDEKTGEIEAKSEGTAIITATTIDNGKEANVEVRVIKEFVPIKGLKAKTPELDGIDANPYLNNGTGHIEAVEFTAEPNDASDKTISIVSVSHPEIIHVEVAPDGESLRVRALKRSNGQKVTITVVSNSNPNVKADFSVISKDSTEYPTFVNIWFEDKGEPKSEFGTGVGYQDKISGEYYKNLTPTIQLKATVRDPHYATNKNVKFSTNNSSAATVDENTGLVTLVGDGIVTITATAVSYDEGKEPAKATCQLIVHSAYKNVESISLPSELSLSTNDLNPTKLNVVFEPSDATDKKVTFVSSRQDVATVDKDTGVVTPLTEGETVITATSNNGNKTAQTTIKVTHIFEPVTGVDIVNFNDINKKELKVGEKVTILGQIAPPNATNKGLTYTVIEGENIVTVNQNGEVTAKEAGKAKVKVEAQGDTSKYKEIEFTVWGKLDLTGNYSVRELNITYNNTTVKSRSIAKRFMSDKVAFSIFTAVGRLKVDAKFQLGWGHFVSDPSWDIFRFKFIDYLDNSLTERQMNKDKYHEKNITVNNDGTITFVFPFTVSGNQLVYSKNSNNKVEFILEKKVTYNQVNESKFLNVTPVHIDDPYSLQGTYTMTFFGTIPKMITCSGLACLGQGQAESPVTTDCATYKTIPYLTGLNSSCGSGNTVSNFAGHITVKKSNNSNSLTIRSKVTMRNGTLDAHAADDKYQYTKYATTNNNDYKNVNGTVKGVEGRNLTKSTRNPESTFSIVSATSSNEKDTGIISINMQLVGKEVHVSGYMKLNANTHVKGKKVSDSVTVLNPNSMSDMGGAHYSSFNTGNVYSDPH